MDRPPGANLFRSEFMTQRKPLIAGNWKMNKTGAEAVATARQLARTVADVTAVEVMVAPPFTALSAVVEAVVDTPVTVGAQDVFWKSSGAYTGEISAEMLMAAGCRYVIVGHSERRQLFGETDDTVNRKIAAAATAGLRPVLCLGETEPEREAGRTFSVLDKQFQKGLCQLSAELLADLVIAYEPVWAIGTGKTATSAQAQEVHAFVRSLLEKAYGANVAQAVRILYGGSAKPDNIAELMSCPDVDGALVGGASLDAETFSAMILT
jgi:triosephosphate isomerase (TIM)